MQISQEDAHEFLVCCLDAVERACFDLYKRLYGCPIKPGQVSILLLPVLSCSGGTFAAGGMRAQSSDNAKLHMKEMRSQAHESLFNAAGRHTLIAWGDV